MYSVYFYFCVSHSVHSLQIPNPPKHLCNIFSHHYLSLHSTVPSYCVSLEMSQSGLVHQLELLCGPSLQLGLDYTLEQYIFFLLAHAVKCRVPYSVINVQHLFKMSCQKVVQVCGIKTVSDSH